MKEQILNELKRSLEEAIERVSTSNLAIRPLTNEEAPPMNLLLLADPSEEKIVSYLSQSMVYVAEKDDKVIGVYVLKETAPSNIEIMNVAVDEDLQGKGLGKLLVLHAIETARIKGANTVEIGTGNSSIQQLALYQKCGFTIKEIWHDHFIENYVEPIVENGIQCRDMVRLEIQL